MKEKTDKNIFDSASKYNKPVKTKNIEIRKAENIAVNKTITLCGSTDFKHEYERINHYLTLAGNVVLSVGVFRENCGDIEKFRPMLEEIHRKKIDMSDMIFIINTGGHIGEHTQSEIDYAQKQGKIIKYLWENDEKKL